MANQAVEVIEVHKKDIVIFNEDALTQEIIKIQDYFPLGFKYSRAKLSKINKDDKVFILSDLKLINHISKEYPNASKKNVRYDLKEEAIVNQIMILHKNQKMFRSWIEDSPFEMRNEHLVKELAKLRAKKHAKNKK